MARSAFLRFAFFPLNIIFFFTCNAKGGGNKMDKVKMKTQQGAQEKVEMERKIGHSRKWAKQRRKGGEMLDGFIWTSVDLIIFL